MTDLDTVEAIALPVALRDRLVQTISDRYPEKTFGYLLSPDDPSAPTDFVTFTGNIRNASEWKPAFESYGRYFVDHDDAGFVATPDESWRIEQDIIGRGLVEVAVFHSHQRHPANFSQIDYEMHLARFGHLWHMIVSMRNPSLPQLRAYFVSSGRVREIPIELSGG